MSDNNNNGGKNRAVGVLGSIVFSLILTLVVFITFKIVL